MADAQTGGATADDHHLVSSSGAGNGLKYRGKIPAHRSGQAFGTPQCFVGKHDEQSSQDEIREARKENCKSLFENVQKEEVRKKTTSELYKTFPEIISYVSYMTKAPTATKESR